MIVGKGLLGQALGRIDREDICFFASGVSNSCEKREKEFEREAILLKRVLAENHDKTVVYFSTCSIYEESQTMYIQHKLLMEQIIQTSSVSKYFIFRLPQVVGRGGNPNTLLNFLINKIKNHESFELWFNVKRNFIDVEDVVFIADKIIRNNTTNRLVNIASPYTIAMVDVIHSIEEYFGSKAIFHSMNKGEAYCIDIAEILKYIDQSEIFLGSQNDYFNRLLMKYYPKES